MLESCKRLECDRGEIRDEVFGKIQLFQVLGSLEHVAVELGEPVPAEIKSLQRTQAKESPSFDRRNHVAVQIYLL